MEWIEIEEGFPPVGVPLILTTYNRTMSRREMQFGQYQKCFKTGNWGFFGENGLIDPDWERVVAWMEIPEPYPYEE